MPGSQRSTATIPTRRAWSSSTMPRDHSSSRPSSGPSWRRRRGMGQPSRSCRSPRPSSGSTAGSSARRSSGPGWAPRRRHRACAGDLLREAYRRYPPAGPETFTDEAALLEACSIAVHVVQGDPGNLKVTLPVDLRRAAAALTGPRTRTGIGHDSHPFGPGMPLRLGGVEIAWRAGAGGPLGRGRRPPRGGRRPARRKRAGRSRSALPGRCADAAGRRQHRARRGGSSPARAGGVATGHGRPHDHRRAAAARRPPRRDAPGDRRAPRARPGRRQRQGLEREPRRVRGRRAVDLGPRHRDGRRRTDDASACTTRCPARPGRSSRCATIGSASTRAGRRSTDPPTSATSGRSCSRTCSSATCAGAATP